MSTPDSDGRHDFDFLYGQWRVHNRKLRERLVGCREWDEFETGCVAWPVLGGLGNVDRFRRAEPDDGGWEGCTIRLFDPADARWRIHWASTGRPGHFEPAMVGSFEDGVGRFSGRDVHDGQPIIVSFSWHGITPSSATWEQRFSDDGGATWELNWVMSLSRVPAPGGCAGAQRW